MNLATPRQPERHLVVTYVLGTFCYPCLRCALRRLRPPATTHRDHSLRWIATSMKAPLGTLGDSQYSRSASSAVEAVPVVNRRDPRALRSAPTADAAARAGGAC